MVLRLGSLKQPVTRARSFTLYCASEEPSCAMKVHVHLPSGDGCSIEVSPATSISELKAAAQQLSKRRLKLTANGQQLDLTATVTEAGLRDRDVVVAVVQLGKLAATHKAFAWYGCGGEVVTWVIQHMVETAARCKSS